MRIQKMERHQSWRPRKTVQSVKAHLSCLDHLHALAQIYKRRLTFFEKLLKDTKRHEVEDQQSTRIRQPHNTEAATAGNRVYFAVSVVKDHLDTIDHLSLDLKQSLETVRTGSFGSDCLN